MYLKSRTGLVAGESRVSIGGTGEEITEAGIGNDTVSEGGTMSDIVIRTCEEKYGT